jgi:hypothetical protein
LDRDLARRSAGVSGPGTIFGPRTRAAIWIVTGVSVIATLAAVLGGPKVARPISTERDSYGAAPLGSRAFVETLEALGMHVLRERRGELGGRAPLLLIEPESAEAIVDGERRELATTLSRRADQGLPTVLVLPKWSYAYGEASPDPGAGEVLSIALPGATLDHEGAPTDPLTSSSASGSLGDYALSLPFVQTIQGASAEVLLARGEDALVVRRGDGLIVVSDPDLLHNWNLQRADHARLMLDVIRLAGADDAVTIDEVFHGHGEQRSLATALGERPTVFLTAQALLVVLLIVWIGSRRFGPPREAAPIGHGPAESIAVSAFVLAEGRPRATLAEAYVREVIAELAERLGLPPGQSIAAQAAHVDRIAARRGEETRAAALLARASALSRGDTRTPLALARETQGFRRRMSS